MQIGKQIGLQIGLSRSLDLLMGTKRTRKERSSFDWTDVANEFLYEGRRITKGKMKESKVQWYGSQFHSPQDVYDFVDCVLDIIDPSSPCQQRSLFHALPDILRFQFPSQKYLMLQVCLHLMKQLFESKHSPTMTLRHNVMMHWFCSDLRTMSLSCLLKGDLHSEWKLQVPQVHRDLIAARDLPRVVHQMCVCLTMYMRHPEDSRFLFRLFDLHESDFEHFGPSFRTWYESYFYYPTRTPPPVPKWVKQFAHYWDIFRGVQALCHKGEIDEDIFVPCTEEEIPSIRLSDECPVQFTPFFPGEPVIVCRSCWNIFSVDAMGEIMKRKLLLKPLDDDLYPGNNTILCLNCCPFRCYESKFGTYLYPPVAQESSSSTSLS